jgi:dTDP-D-glucose 4,6-dehydratase
VLDWSPRVSLQEGLRQTVSWYAENPDWWKPLLPMRRVPIMFKNGETIYY